MKRNDIKRNDQAVAEQKWNGQQGFTLIETTIAFVVMMIVGLGAASLFVFALGSNTSARDRELSMAVAQQQMELLRSTRFINLDATVTANGGATKTVTSGGRPYTVITTITDTVAGNATQKTVTVRVTPIGHSDAALSAIQRVFGGVTLVTLRSTNLLGPNRG
jgi:Tfp pilus assembly protein PilV